MSYFEFPGTRTYDKDLGWLIKEYKELSANYQDILNTVKDLENKYDTIPQRIQEAINQIIGNVQSILANMQKKLDGFKVDLTDLESHVFQTKMLFLEMSSELFRYVDAKDYELFVKLDTRIDNIVKEWPKLIDPSDGYTEDLQTILFHIWNDLSQGIPVSEFDSMNIVVSVFDNMQISVWRFDTYGREIFADRRIGYMESPFTGEYVPISDVVTKLASLHMHGITVQDFDALEIAVEEFDARNIPVFNFDWDGFEVFEPFEYTQDAEEDFILQNDRNEFNLTVMKVYNNVVASTLPNSEEFNTNEQAIYCGHVSGNPFKLTQNTATAVAFTYSPAGSGGVRIFARYDGTITQLYFRVLKTAVLDTLYFNAIKL